MKITPKEELPDERFDNLCYLRIGNSCYYITSEYDKLNGMGKTKGITYATTYTREIAELISKALGGHLIIENYKG